jgi:RNA polymerase sigma-70 factor (ECF subfamily)
MNMQDKDFSPAGLVEAHIPEPAVENTMGAVELDEAAPLYLDSGVFTNRFAKGQAGLLTDDLAARLGPRLYRYFYATFPSSLASDLVQEVFLRLIPRLGQVDEKRGNLITYAYGIAHNVRKEALRQRQRDHRSDSLGPENEPVYDDPVFDRIEQREAAERLKTAIASLKEEERAVVLLLIEGDIGMNEIAEALGMPIGTVKSHIHRAKIRLKALLDPVRTE